MDTWNEDQGSYLIWAGYTLTGFLPVYLAAKLAPSRQLPLAIESALLVATWAVSVCVLIIVQWRGGAVSGNVVASFLGYNLATLGGAASSVWLVKRNRAADPERGSTWARATGLMLPVALFAGIVAEGFMLYAKTLPSRRQIKLGKGRRF